MEFLDKHFELVTESRDGVVRLRDLVLKLAMQGKLVPQQEDENSAQDSLTENQNYKDSLLKQRAIKKQKPTLKIGKNEIPFELPKSWEWARLNDFGLWKSGSTPNRTNNSFYEGTIPWVKSGEVKQGLIKVTSETITELALEKCSLDVNPRGSVLLAMYGANIGEVGILDIDAATNQAVCACQTYPTIDNKFLFFLLLSLKQNFISQGAGAAQPNISREKIINTVVPLPGKQEQKRIVQKIERLLKLCDELEYQITIKEVLLSKINNAAINRLSKAETESVLSKAWSFIQEHFGVLYNEKANVKKLKSIILELAIRGKLADPLPKNYDLKELFAFLQVEKLKFSQITRAKEKTLSPVKKEEIPFMLPEGWTWVRLGFICSKIGSGSTPRGGKNAYQVEGIKFIRSQNVHNSGLKFENVVFIDPKTHEKMANTKVLPNDLLLNITGGSIGRCALVPADFTQANVSQHVTIIRLLPGIEHQFVHQFILSSYFQNRIMEVQTGGNREGLAKKNMELMLVPLPPRQAQISTVAKVNTLIHYCELLEYDIDRSKIKRTEILNSVLANI